MRDQIIEKLNKHIEKVLSEEADVVYLLVQLGKLLEHHNKLRAYPVLHFYRNWVVHHKLDRVLSNPTMKDLLDKLEAAAAAHKAKTDKQTVLRLLSDTLSLKKLWLEMETVFNENSDFDRAVLNRPEPWANLGGLLLNILIDLPLEAPPSYKFIKEIRFSKAIDKSHIARMHITLQSGETIKGPVVDTRLADSIRDEVSPGI